MGHLTRSEAATTDLPPTEKRISAELHTDSELNVLIIDKRAHLKFLWQILRNEHRLERLAADGDDWVTFRKYFKHVATDPVQYSLPSGPSVEDEDWQCQLKTHAKFPLGDIEVDYVLGCAELVLVEPNRARRAINRITGRVRIARELTDLLTEPTILPSTETEIESSPTNLPVIAV